MLIKIPQNLINNFGGEHFWSLIDLILCSYDRPSLDFESFSLCQLNPLLLLFLAFFYFQILSVSAIVLANLCVSYIMTSANEEVCFCFFHRRLCCCCCCCILLQASVKLQLRKLFFFVLLQAEELMRKIEKEEVRFENEWSCLS